MRALANQPAMQVEPIRDLAAQRHYASFAAISALVASAVVLAGALRGDTVMVPAACASCWAAGRSGAEVVRLTRARIEFGADGADRSLAIRCPASRKSPRSSCRSRRRPYAGCSPTSRSATRRPCVAGSPWRPGSWRRWRPSASCRRRSSSCHDPRIAAHHRRSRVDVGGRLVAEQRRRKGQVDADAAKATRCRADLLYRIAPERERR